MHAYIAGPLFNDGERWYNEILDEIAQSAGMTTYLPQRDAGVLDNADDANRIFRLDVSELDRCDIVIANLNGITTDDGTAWELGYAYAFDKHLVGIFDDTRKRSAIVTLNLMLEESLDRLCFSLDELRKYINEYGQASRE